MWIIWITIGVAIGWLIPQPKLRWSGNGQEYGLLAWTWMWIRDKAGMN